MHGRAIPHPRCWPSASPAKYGRDERQKANPGWLKAASGAARVVACPDDKWHLMAIERNTGQWHEEGTVAAVSGPSPFGCVVRIDLTTLDVLAASRPLPFGGHVWWGAVPAHTNWTIMSGNGDNHVGKWAHGALKIAEAVVNSVLRATGNSHPMCDVA